MVRGMIVLRQMICQIGIISAGLVVAAITAHAQATFSLAMNVSNNAGNSQIPQIAVDSSGHINMIWLDNTPGNFSVFFSRSSDGGGTFSSPLNLSNNPGGSANGARVGVDSAGNIYVAWFDGSSGTPGIFFRRSTDGGATFSSAMSQPATQGALMAVDPAGKIYLAWTASDNSGIARLVFSRSLDGGATFSNPLTISNPSVTAILGAIALDASGNINVAWTEAAPPQGLDTIYFSRSTDGGTTFSSPSQVTNSGGPMLRVAGLAVDASGSIHVLWTDALGGQTDTFLNLSSNGGATFAAENFQAGVSDFAQSAQLALDARGGINVVWHTGDANPVVNFARSADEGASFATQNIAGNDFSDPSPAAMATDSSGNINIIWTQAAGPSAPGGLLFTRSTDAGQTFSAHQQIAGTGGQNVTAVADSADNIYTAWSQLVGTGNGDIFFSRSTAPPVPAPSLSSVSLSPSSVTGGNVAACTVSLSGPAAAGGTTVLLSSSNLGVASVPPSVTVPAGTSSGAFSVTTSAVATATSISISASFNGVTQTSPLTVVPPALASLTLNPTRVTSGSSSTGTVTLTGPAPNGGIIVTLSSSNGKAAVPANATVPAGSSSATFLVSTNMVRCPSRVTISGLSSGLRLTASLGISPPFALPAQACRGIRGPIHQPPSRLR
jgi:hypothetical protein